MALPTAVNSQITDSVTQAATPAGTKALTSAAPEAARANMIEQQVRPWEVLDQRVLAAMAEVPREAFVAEGCRDFAFTDVELPLGHGQFMLKPVLEGRLLQALAVGEDDTVLEIGTGSGYLTACLAALGRQVVSVELIPELAAAARVRLEAQDVTNVTVEEGDGAAGWAKRAPYHAILVGGSLPEVPAALKRQLTVGGRLVVVVGEGEPMEARLITRTADDAWHEAGLFDTYLAPLANAPRRSHFVL